MGGIIKRQTTWVGKSCQHLRWRESALSSLGDKSHIYLSEVYYGITKFSVLTYWLTCFELWIKQSWRLPSLQSDPACVFIPWPEYFTSPEGLILNLACFPGSAPNSTAFMFYVILFLLRKLERQTSAGLWAFSMNRRGYLPLGIHVYEGKYVITELQLPLRAGPADFPRWTLRWLWLSRVISMVLSIIFWEMKERRKMISKISLS